MRIIGRMRKEEFLPDISVEVVSCPQKADQSFTTIPPPTTSLPLFTVPANIGIWSKEDSSSKSSGQTS